MSDDDPNFVGTAADFARIAKRDADLRGLLNVARQVFLDRNAAGFVKAGRELRLRSREGGRPHLRDAVSAAQMARDALADNDRAAFERWRAEARMHLAHARAAMRSPLLERVAKAVNRPPDRVGGRTKTVDVHRRWADDFDRCTATNPRRDQEDICDDIAAQHSKTHVAVTGAQVQAAINKVRQRGSQT